MTPPERALDRLNLLVASSQTGFGALVAVYLTSHAWTQAAIGEALSIGTVTAVVSQLPAGLLVDWMRSKRLAIGLGGAAIMVAALLLAAVPTALPVYLAEILHGFASCIVTPAIAAVSIQVAANASPGASLERRLGRNAQFASVGSGVAAAALGAVGSLLSNRAVFWLTAAIMGAGLLSLRALPTGKRTADTPARRAPGLAALRKLLTVPFLVFALAIAAFQLGNAAMLPLVAGEITRSAGRYASLVIAAGIVVPQLVVAVLSAPAATLAASWGRRPVLLAGFAALPIRGLLLALTQHPVPVILVQALDGVSGAVLGVMVPLLAADLAQRLGAFNLCMGLFGLAVGAGATLSTLLAGAAADTWSPRIALAGLACAGLLAVLLVSLMPETRPR